MIALIMLLSVVLTLMVVAIALPFVREAITGHHEQQVREQQQLVEARLRVLNQFTMQRMHETVRQQRVGLRPHPLE
jgi:hypothetical protein